MFRVYSGTLKAKKWHFGEYNYSSKGLLHYSEFWTMLKDMGYSGRNKIPQIVMIIKDIKVEKTKDPIKGELFLDFDEFKKLIINFLMMDSIKN